LGLEHEYNIRIGDGMNNEKKVTVIALGGNAILKPGQQGTFDEQMINVKTTCEQLAQMVESGKYKVIVTHGNGPQVGNLLLQNEAGKDVAAPMPLYVCGAESQGLIGYMIQQTLHNLLVDKGKGGIPIATVVTQVVVDKDDQAFQNPSKPVGPFYSAEEANKLETEKGYHVREDAGRGWRRVVPSPDPIEIFEKEAIRQLIEARSIVIASGGGGIPVLKEGDKLIGIDAVIDKDLAGERLAVDVEAKIFLILTDVEQVKLNYKRRRRKACRTSPSKKQSVIRPKGTLQRDRWSRRCAQRSDSSSLAARGRSSPRSIAL